jgi:hypothetical protein
MEWMGVLAITRVGGFWFRAGFLLLRISFAVGCILFSIGLGCDVLSLVVSICFRGAGFITKGVCICLCSITGFAWSHVITCLLCSISSLVLLPICSSW